MKKYETYVTSLIIFFRCYILVVAEPTTELNDMVAASNFALHKKKRHNHAHTHKHNLWYTLLLYRIFFQS